MTPKASQLDDPTRLRENDPGDMLSIVESTPAMWRDAIAGARESTAPEMRPARAVVVCGMGGSGVAGDVLAAIAATRAVVPVSVVKGFDLPKWVSEDDLVMCVSYSGNTEEALSCFDEGRVRGSQLIAVAGGGALAARAEEAKAPWLRLAPPGLMPRAAFPSIAGALLVAGERAGLVAELDDERDALLDACERGLAQWGSDVPSDRNEAKQLALKLETGVTQIWGQEGALAVAAMRWKTQLNENAKINASWAVLPESLHNEIVPLSGAERLVLLRSDVERERIAAAIGALEEYRPIHARAIGVSDLATLASAVLLGDLVSVYVAALRGVDPTPIEAIQRFKRAIG